MRPSTPRQKYNVENAKVEETMATSVKGRAVFTVKRNPEAIEANASDAVVEVA